VKRADSLVGRCRAAFRRHERQLAIAWLTTALVVSAVLAVNPVRRAVLSTLQHTVDHWDARWSRRMAEGEALVASGRYEEAAAYLERLDRVFPAQNVRHARDTERERLMQLLARSYEALGRTDRARAAYDNLVAFDSLNYYNYFERARAAERMSSGRAAPVEARDDYATALRRFPGHLASLRGYIGYHMDREDFIPVVEAYRAYLDAFLAQHLTLRLDTASMGLMVSADGLPRTVELPLRATADGGTTLSIETRGFPLRVEGITAVSAVRVGSPRPAHSVEIAPIPLHLTNLEAVGDGALRPTDTTTSVVFRVPPIEGGIASIRLRLRLYKPVDEPLWQQVARSYRDLVDEDGLRQAEVRTVGLVDAELADRVMLTQIWVRGGLLGRIDVGT
jgi:tetratricopeptide (TPR) repeat protein